MYPQVPRFTSQLRRRLFAFIVACLFVGTESAFSQTTDLQNPPTTSDQDIRTWKLPDGAILRLGKGVLGGSDRAIAFSPDGIHLAVASGIGIWIYGVETGGEVALLNGGRPALIRSVAYSPDGTIIAAGTGDYGQVQLWEVKSGRLFNSLVRPGPGILGNVDALAFSPDGRTLASGTWNDISLWDVEKQQHLKTLEGHEGRIFSLAFSPDGATLASAAEDDTVKLWEVTTRKLLTTLIHTGRVFSVAFSPDGATLASAADKTVTLWNVSTQERVAALKHSYHVNSVAYSPDGTTVVSGSWREVNIWDVSTEKSINTFEHKYRVGAVVISPDGKYLASANTDRFGGTDGTVVLWNVSAKENVATFRGHTERVTTTAFVPDGIRLATMSRDAKVKFWDVGTGQHVSTLHETRGWSMAFSPDGKTLALGKRDGTVKLSDVKSGRRVAMLRGHGGMVESLTYTPDGTMLAAGARGVLAVGVRGADESPNGMVRLWTIPPKPWEVLTRRGYKTLEVDTERGISVAFSPDGKMFATGSKNGVRLYDAETGKSIATLQESRSGSVAFSRDGTVIAAGSDDGIKLWEIPAKTIIATLPRMGVAGISMVFSPGGSTLATGMDGKIEFWDLSTRRNVATRFAHGAWISSLAFSPDGSTLASGSQDGTVLLWKTSELTE